MIRSPAPSQEAGIADEPTRPLNPLDEIVGYQLRRAQMATFQELIDQIGALDLRPAQLALLMVLEKNPGLNQTVAASMLAIKAANFVTLMDALEARELARRATSPSDRRERSLYLTVKGCAIARSASRILAEHEQVLVKRLGGPEAKVQFLDMLNRVAGGTT